METIQYTPRGVCAQKMEIDVEDGVSRAVRVLGGCSGNLQGLSALLKGMTVDEAVAREALRLAMHKLPIKCKFVVREDAQKEVEAE